MNLLATVCLCLLFVCSADHLSLHGLFTKATQSHQNFSLLVLTEHLQHGNTTFVSNTAELQQLTKELQHACNNQQRMPRNGLEENRNYVHDYLEDPDKGNDAVK